MSDSNPGDHTHDFTFERAMWVWLVSARSPGAIKFKPMVQSLIDTCQSALAARQGSSGPERNRILDVVFRDPHNRTLVLLVDENTGVGFQKGTVQGVIVIA